MRIRLWLLLALSLFAALTVLTGLLYPALVTGLAQLAFADTANGSVVVRHGVAVGSALIGQPFQAPAHFWSRPSATSARPSRRRERRRTSAARSPARESRGGTVPGLGRRDSS